MTDLLLLRFSHFMTWIAVPFTTGHGIPITSALDGFVTGPQLVLSVYIFFSPMMPPKPKGMSRKAKGAAATTPSKKQTTKATKHVQAFEQLEQDRYETEGEETGLTGDEAIPTTQKDLAQRMDVMVTMLLDLSRKVQASEA